MLVDRPIPPVPLMLVSQLQYKSGHWHRDADGEASHAQLVLVFGDRMVLRAGGYLPELQRMFPAAEVVCCSSGGDIKGASATEGGLVATAIAFGRATLKVVEEAVSCVGDSEDAGARVGRRLLEDGLRHVFVLCEGLNINGSALARGLDGSLPDSVSVSGGLAGDGEHFVETVVGVGGRVHARRVVGIGFYGEHLEVGVGSFGGWEPFGPDRLVTRADGNVLYELDGRPALDVYQELLGPFGYALPASGLLFPLKIRRSVTGQGVIRTILGVDEGARSVTFAGDVPEGWTARLVRTQLDALIAAAGTAADRSRVPGASGPPDLTLAVSCIGRRLLLQQRVDEELQQVQLALGSRVLAGFYSYGELAPARNGSCELHNQTMTLTTLRERPA